MATTGGSGYNGPPIGDSMMTGAIYRIEISRGDRPSSFYFGQSVNSKERWRQHLRALRAGRHDNTRMQRSFMKYGESAFSFSVILVCEPTTAAMTLYEQAILDFYLTELGDGRIMNVMRQCVNTHLGVKRRPESIERLAAALRGKKKTPAQIEAMAARMRGTKRSIESRDAQSAKMKAAPRHPNSLAALEGARSAPARLEGLRAALVGKPKIHSDETKSKIAASLTGRKQSQELVEKRIGPLRGRKQTKEEIAKRVASRLANSAARAC